MKTKKFKLLKTRKKEIRDKINKIKGDMQIVVFLPNVDKSDKPDLLVWPLEEVLSQKYSFCTKSQRFTVLSNNGKLITNLQLQKIMYFSIKRVNVDNSFLENLYDEPFQVWRYGPVVKSIYDKYKIFGTRIIISSGNLDKRYKIFDDEISSLLRVPVWNLISDSLKEKKWQDNKSKIVLSTSNVGYYLSDVRKYREES